MKRTAASRIVSIVATLCGSVLLAVPTLALAQVPDQILDLYVEARIDADGTTRIEETVLYDFGPKRIHGIYRNIPIQAQEGNLLRKFGIEDVSVTERDGAPVPFEVASEKTYLRVKIGDPNALITGVHEYHISYTAKTVLRGFSKFDEWLWDATSSNWPVVIRRARVSVTFPKPILIPELIRKCITGSAGFAATSSARETCQVGFIEPAATGTVSSVQMMDLDLVPKESMYVALGFPKGFFPNVPEVKEDVKLRASAFPQLLGGVLMLLLVGVLARAVVRARFPTILG